MKIIRWWGIVAFISLIILFTLVWYLFAPHFIASSIERTGSEIIGAKVDVGDVELTLIPLSLQIKQLQAADPDAPMTNLFEADSITMSIDSSSLLWKKIVIEELELSGAKTGSERKVSGKLEGGRQSTQAINEMVELVVPDVKNIDVNELVEKADLVTIKRINTFKAEKDKISKEWESALDKEAFEKRSAAIEIEFNRLKARAKDNKMNLIADRKDWKKLKADIDQERKNISQLSDKMKQDKQQLSEQLTSIKKGPADDLDAIMNKMGVGNGVDGLVDKYIGPQYTPWVKQAIEMVNSMKSSDGKDKTPEEEKAVVAVGDRVFYQDEKVFPDLLIKKVKLNGAGSGFTVDGNGINLGYLPWLTGKPAKLNLDFAGNGKAMLDISSNWPSKTSMKTQLSSKVDGWQLNAMELMQTPNGQWMINSGQLAATIDGNMTLEKIDLKANFSISSPKLSFPETISGWQKGLAESINQQQSISFNLTATGSLEKPSIRLNSSLEGLFQAAIGEQIKQKANELKADIKKKISEKTGDLSKFESYKEDLAKWQSMLKQKDDLLDGLKDSIKI